MKNTTKSILAFFGMVLSATIILLTSALLMITPAEMVSTGGVVCLILGSVVVLTGVGSIGVHALLHKED